MNRQGFRTQTGKRWRHSSRSSSCCGHSVKLVERSEYKQRQTPVYVLVALLLVIWRDAILDGLKTILDFGRTLMAEGSVTVNRQHIPAWLVERPQFSVGIPLEPTTLKDASEIEDEACRPRFWLNCHRDEFLSSKLCRCPFNSPD